MNWLNWLEKRMGWLAVPNLAILIVTLQALGSFMVMNDPAWFSELALFPWKVSEGEYWRLITYLSLPLSQNPIWMILVLWFLYFILSTIEAQWGAFKTTLYVLFSILFTTAYSMITGFPVTSAGHFESTLFLAAACLFPEMEVSLFLILPVKMKWLAAVSGALVIWQMITAGWLERGYLAVIYANFILFFAPSAIDRIKQAWRKQSYKNKLGGR